MNDNLVRAGPHIGRTKYFSVVLFLFAHFSHSTVTLAVVRGRDRCPTASPNIL